MSTKTSPLALNLHEVDRPQKLQHTETSPWSSRQAESRKHEKVQHYINMDKSERVICILVIAWWLSMYLSCYFIYNYNGNPKIIPFLIIGITLFYIFIGQIIFELLDLNNPTTQTQDKKIQNANNDKASKNNKDSNNDNNCNECKNDYADIYDENRYLIEPYWKDEDRILIHVDSISFEGFLEDVLHMELEKFKILPRLPRNEETGNARVATRLAKVYYSSDMFPTVDEEDNPELYASQKKAIKLSLKEVRCYKPDTQCKQSLWLKKHDGEVFKNHSGKKYMIDYANMMNKTTYYIYPMTSCTNPLLEDEYYNNYNDNGFLIEPMWDYDEISLEDIDEVMDLEYFEENILRRKVRYLSYYKRNNNGNARLKTTNLRVWICDDCFPIISKDIDPGLYAEKAAEIKKTQKIVQMAKNLPCCIRSEWYLRHDGEIAINNFGIKFRVSYKEEMEATLYFIHRIDYDEYC